MNPELSRLAVALGLDAADQEPLRLAFGLACAERVQHLLEAPEAVAGVAALRAFVDGRLARPALEEAARRVAEVARSHPGSRSLDGAAHAAVSATHAVAQALAGRALEAASYAAYASVYAYGGYAVRDPEAFAEEFTWQLHCLRGLAQPPAVPAP
ncbi:hypothetical protein [Variovorax terrae]|uniref:Uncharacterized protein n=1 Tax=Variovorax terrae TaxID=2923278 RepID=A0A9X1VUD6_9BURK|nr:hypothetical protein [Variovorax terrae]MCJ0763497.1 hypothetical protein [Variovorax terrae]